MHILMVAHGWPLETMGGVGLYVKAIGEAFHAVGERVTILTPMMGKKHRLRIKRTAWCHHWVLEQPAPQTWEEAHQRPISNNLFHEQISTDTPDVIHIHHMAHLPLGLLERLPQHILKVMTLHDYALPCARGQLTDAHWRQCNGPSPPKCATCISAQFSLSPLTSRLSQAMNTQTRRRIRTFFDNSPSTPSSRWRIGRRISAARRLLHNIDLLLAPSHDLCSRMVAMGWPRPTHHPLPLLRSIPPASPFPEGPTRFLFAGSLIPTKGVHLLMDAFESLPEGEATLTIVGPSQSFDGAPGYAEKLRERASQHRNIWMPGLLPHSQIPALLRAHHVLVLPSIWPENSPIIVREAAAAGLKVICSQQGGSGELTPYATRVQRNDRADLASAMQQHLSEWGRKRNPIVLSADTKEHILSLQSLYNRL